MLFRSTLIIALASTTQGFNPVASSRQWRQLSQESRTSLFETAQATAWTAEQWTEELTSTDSPDAFAPSSADLEAAAQAFSKKTVMKTEITPTKLGIENEFPNKRKIRANVRETGMDSMKNYIKSMCNQKKKKKNEEIILAREIQLLLKWEEQREQLEQQLLR